MENGFSGWTIQQLAELVGGTVGRSTDKLLTRLVPAGWPDPNGITFAENAEYTKLAESVDVGAMLVKEGNTPEFAPFVIVGGPRQAFGKLLILSRREPNLDSGVHPTAIIHATADVDATASVGAYCVIGPSAKIGGRVRIHSHCYVGDRSNIHDDCVLYPHCVVMPDVVVGDRTILHSGSVVGADGFGFIWNGEKHVRIPHVGGVNLGAEVEVGANACVDRSTCGDTLIGEGTKLDNLVMVAHNCRIGDHTVIASQTGMAGSVTVGSNVVMGGQVAIRDHLTVGDNVKLAGRTTLARDVTEPGDYFGTPALPAREGMKVMLLTSRLPELYDRIRALEKEIDKLKGES